MKDQDLVAVIATRGRAYSQKNGRRVALQLFSKDSTLMDKLCATYGGQSYRHGSGRLWIVGKGTELRTIWQVLEPKLEGQRPPRFAPLYKYVGDTHDVDVAEPPGDNRTSEAVEDDRSVPA